MLIHSPINSCLSCLRFVAVTGTGNRHSPMCLPMYICPFLYRTGGELLACGISSFTFILAKLLFEVVQSVQFSFIIVSYFASLV